MTECIELAKDQTERGSEHRLPPLNWKYLVLVPTGKRKISGSVTKYVNLWAGPIPRNSWPTQNEIRGLFLFVCGRFVLFCFGFFIGLFDYCFVGFVIPWGLLLFFCFVLKVRGHTV